MSELGQLTVPELVLRLEPPRTIGSVSSARSPRYLRPLPNITSAPLPSRPLLLFFSSFLLTITNLVCHAPVLIVSFLIALSIVSSSSSIIRSSLLMFVLQELQNLIEVAPHAVIVVLRLKANEGRD